MADEPSVGAQAAEDGGLSTLSQFAAKILDQLSLSAWLPAALLAATLTLEIQFRDPKTTNLSKALSNITDNVGSFLLLIVPVMVLATMLTQAFSFGAIRVLEGYWRRRGPLSWYRTWLIKRQARRYDKLCDRRREAGIKAFSWARSQLIADDIPAEVINRLESFAVNGSGSPLAEEYKAEYGHYSWDTLCRPWEVAKVEQLVMQIEDYTPLTYRIMPTRLGNVQRYYEDGIENDGGNLETFAMRNRSLAAPVVQVQHDQFRQRLDMYCTLVFVSTACVPLSGALLTKQVTWWAEVLVCVGFALLAWAAYLSAIASARGLGATLQVMDQAAGELAEQQAAGGDGAVGGREH